MVGTAALMLALGAGGVLPPPVPMPVATPLVEIGHVVATPFCTMLRDKARPAIAGLMLNDDLTDYVGPVIARYYRDAYADRSPAADFDIVRMRDVASRMAHNLSVVDVLIAAIPTPDPDAAPTNASRQTEELRAKLLAVRTAQNEEINVVSGLAETEAMAEFQSRKDPMGGIGAPDAPGFGGARQKVDPALPEGWAGIRPGATDAGDPRVLLEGTLLGANVDSSYLGALSVARAKVRRNEGGASTAILAMAAGCRAPQPSPSPGP